MWLLTCRRIGVPCKLKHDDAHLVRSFRFLVTAALQLATCRSHTNVSCASVAHPSIPPDEATACAVFPAPRATPVLWPTLLRPRLPFLCHSVSAVGAPFHSGRKLLNFNRSNQQTRKKTHLILKLDTQMMFQLRRTRRTF